MKLQLFNGFVLSVGLILLTLASFLMLLRSTQAAPPGRPLLVPGNPITNPISNSHTARRSTIVSITYDEAINPATVSTQTFAVHAMQTGLLAQTYSVNGGTISLTPSQPFKPGDLVQVSATTGTLNLSGQGPISPTVWQFRTAVSGGSGVFSDTGQALGNSVTVDVILGDIDGDGDLDAFVTNTSGIRVWLNNGRGLFSDSGQSLTNTYSHGVALGDVDGDGDLDAFTVHGGPVQNPHKVWLNNGMGAFSDSGQSLGSSYGRSVALGDFDGDGDLDAFVANRLGQPNTVWLNNGMGTFSDSGQALGNGFSTGVALGDVDGDSDLDAFVSNEVGSKVWLNNGSGGFSDSGQTLNSPVNNDVALGDLDGDGDLDAFAANGGAGGNPNKVWLNNGSGTFSDSGQSLGSFISGGVWLGDLDRDGDLDAFVTTQQGNRVWRNDGTGTFVDSGQALGNSISGPTALGDLDGDGDLDAFVGNQIPTANTVWLNLNFAYLPIVVKSTPNVVFSENFNDGELTNNPTWNLIANSAYAIINGELHSDGLIQDLSDRYRNVYRSDISFQAPDYLEFSYRGLLKQVGNPQTGRGVKVNVIGTNGNNYQLNIQRGFVDSFPNDKFSLSLSGGTPSTQFDMIVTSFQPEYDQMYDIRAVRQSGIWTLSVDGVIIGTAADPFALTDFEAVGMITVGSVVVDDIVVKR